ncbi:uncharacterized protein BDV14DRAFT_87270 [Aspergillus stella-maris]|uniref:uncharacterized protein n=1 Tax=Aspergillus stella-maris TaxID=1810926 RepID=UPI003CCDD2FB
MKPGRVCACCLSLRPTLFTSRPWLNADEIIYWQANTCFEVHWPLEDGRVTISNCMRRIRPRHDASLDVEMFVRPQPCLTLCSWLPRSTDTDDLIRPGRLSQ